MKTFAYCSASFRRFVRRAAGTSPILCPPTTMATFDPRLPAGSDFVWFKLHGLEGQPYWYGDNYTTALSARQLAQADLEGAVVFVSNCYLANDDGSPGPMLQALAHARPKAIIGGPGTNYALPDRLGATDLLALYVRWFLQVGFATYNALRMAKLRLQLRRLRQPRWADRTTEDTLAFRIWQPAEIPGISGERQISGRIESDATPGGPAPACTGPSGPRKLTSAPGAPGGKGGHAP